MLSDSNELAGAIRSLRAFDALRVERATTSSPTATEKPAELDLAIGEWAEELAAISKRRNILERNLRDIALNFVRQDAVLKGKPNGDSKTGILAVMAETRRKTALRHLSAGEAIAKFNWTDIVALIIRK